jgi:uncharacterized protein YndB with AHSA1/START domain
MSIISIEVFFEVSKEKVWEAITNTDAMKVWYFDIANFNLNIGTKFSFYEGGKKEYLHEGEVLKVEVNKLFQHTWLHPEQSKGSSVVTWKIDEVEGKTKVTLTHEGVENFADAGPNFTIANYEMGWNALVKTNLRNYLYNIKNLIFTQEINASAETVWNLMWDKKVYIDWTSPFCEGSYYTGEIELGSRIHFMTPSGQGMYGDVFYLIPNKFIIFKHIGNVLNFNEMPLDAETEKWTGSFEAYKLDEVDGKTTLIVEVDCVEQYVNYMNEKFPFALQELKKIAENK